MVILFVINYSWIVFITTGSNLLPDYFLDGEDLLDMVKEAKAKEETTKDSKVKELFKNVSQYMTEDVVKETQCVYLFDIDGERWVLDLKNGAGSIKQVGNDVSEADITMTMKEDVMVNVFTGKQNPATAYMTGKLKMKGDLGKAMKLQKLMSRLQKKTSKL